VVSYLKTLETELQNDISGVQAALVEVGECECVVSHQSDMSESKLDGNAGILSADLIPAFQSAENSHVCS